MRSAALLGLLASAAGEMMVESMEQAEPSVSKRDHGYIGRKCAKTPSRQTHPAKTR